MVNQHQQRVLETLRARNEPTIDGSYLLVSSKPFAVKFLHKAYTPKQYQAEESARQTAVEQGKVVHVAFLREPREPIPVWVSPPVKRPTKTCDALVFTVAPSRKQRHKRGLEVVITASDLDGKNSGERKEFIEAAIVNAISSVLKAA